MTGSHDGRQCESHAGQTSSPKLLLILKTQRKLVWPLKGHRDNRLLLQSLQRGYIMTG